MTLAPLVPRATLDCFFDGLGTLLYWPERKASFALYALGLLGESERKSAEPIAARAASGDPRALPALPRPALPLPQPLAQCGRIKIVCNFDL